MAQQNDPNMPNQAANKEKAEGSRENTNEAGGISNLPLDEEQKRQENLPPRGDSRESVTHGRQSHVVNEGAEDKGDSTLKTDI